MPITVVNKIWSILYRVVRGQVNVLGCEQMLQDIDQALRYTHQLLGFTALSSPVRQALCEVPRDAFVPDALPAVAYENRPLPIAASRTISQLYIVAIIITAAATDRAPPPLIDQLKPGGRLIVPLNNGFGQKLVPLHEAAKGDIRQRSVLPVTFVPMTGVAKTFIEPASL